jgi:hypothetical protein
LRCQGCRRQAIEMVRRDLRRRMRPRAKGSRSEHCGSHGTPGKLLLWGRSIEGPEASMPLVVRKGLRCASYVNGGAPASSDLVASASPCTIHGSPNVILSARSLLYVSRMSRNPRLRAILSGRKVMWCPDATICHEQASRSGPPRLLPSRRWTTRGPRCGHAAYRQTLLVMCCLWRKHIPTFR